MWNGKKPKVNHLRVFGSDAYAHVPRDKRAKFDTKTHKCIMVGYGNVTKGYRLYDATEGKIIYSCDVQFNEKVKECLQNTEDTARSDYQLIVDFSEGSEIEIEMDHDVTQPEQVKESSPLEPQRSTRIRRQPTTMAKRVVMYVKFHNHQYPIRRLLQGQTRESGKLHMLWKQR